MRRSPRYADLMAEARAEYAAWLARPSVVIVPLGPTGIGVVYHKTGRPGARTEVCECGRAATRRGRCDGCRRIERAARMPSCACGGEYFARGMCRPCYYRALNEERPRVGSGRQQRRLGRVA